MIKKMFDNNNNRRNSDEGMHLPVQKLILGYNSRRNMIEVTGIKKQQQKPKKRADKLYLLKNLISQHK